MNPGQSEEAAGLEQRLLLVLETLAVSQPGLSLMEALPIVTHAFKTVDWEHPFDARNPPPNVYPYNLQWGAAWARRHPFIVDSVKSGQLIDAIKEYRRLSEAGLKDSKYACERLRDELRAAGTI